ncbi:MAG: hypothetical protein ACR2NI_04385 [Pirellulales bacterium]
MRRDKFTAIPSDSEKTRIHSTVNWPVKFLLTKLHLIRDALPRPELTVLVNTIAASGKLLNSTCAVHPEECFGIASCARRLLQRAYSYLDMNLVSKEVVLIAKEFSTYTINFYIS